MTTASVTSGRCTAGYPVTMTDTPVTADAATLLELKSGAAAPAESRVPLTSASDAFPAPVSVTL